MAKETKIKQKLQAANISQAEVARELKLTVQHVNYVVNGRRESRRLVLHILRMCNRKKSKQLS